MESKTLKVNEIPYPLRPRFWHKRDWDRYEMSLVAYDYGKKERWVVTEVTLTQFEANDPLPCMYIPSEEIQDFMDELWRCGVRPSEVGTAGHVQAVQAHADYLEKTLDAVLPSALKKPG